MSLISFDWDVCSKNFLEVLTSSVLDCKSSWHFCTVEFGRGVDKCRVYPSYKVKQTCDGSKSGFSQAAIFNLWPIWLKFLYLQLHRLDCESVSMKILLENKIRYVMLLGSSLKSLYWPLLWGFSFYFCSYCHPRSGRNCCTYRTENTALGTLIPNMLWYMSIYS